MTSDEVTGLIQAALPGAQVRIVTDDNTHYEAVVVAPQFEGKRPLQLPFASSPVPVGLEHHRAKHGVCLCEPLVELQRLQSRHFGLWETLIGRFETHAAGIGDYGQTFCSLFC